MSVAVVTGGASGFGLALGAGFAARGMRVVLLDLDADRAEAEAGALETSTAAQPDHLRRDIGAPDDFEAMLASNPALSSDLDTPETAAANAVDAILAGERYIVTHGNLVDAVDTRSAALREAAARARGG